MRPKQHKTPANKCNLEEYLNQNTEVKSILEEVPAVKKYIRNILKTYSYCKEDFDSLFAKTGGCYISIDCVKILIQHGNIQAASISSLLYCHSTRAKTLVALLPKLTDSRVLLLKEYGIAFSSIASIVRSVQSNNIATAIEEILDKIFILQANGAYTLSPQLTKVLKYYKCSFSNIAIILRGIKSNIGVVLAELLQILESSKISKLHELGINFHSLSSILGGAGAAGPQALDKLLQILDDTRIQELKNKRIHFSSLSSILGGAGAAGPQALDKLLQILDDTVIQKLDDKGIHFSSLSSILSGAGAAGSQALDKLLQILDSTKIEALLNREIDFSNFSTILSGAGAAGPQALDKLLQMLDNSILRKLENKGISFSNLSSILSKAGTAGPQALEKLLKLLDNARIQELENNGIHFSSLSSILRGAGAAAPQALDKLLKLLDNARIQELENNGIHFSSLSSILSRAGSDGAKALKGLLQLLDSTTFTLLQKYEIKFSNFCTILSGSGAKAKEVVQKVLELLSDQQLDVLGKKQFFENSSKFARSGANTPVIFKKFLSSSLDESMQQTKENTCYTIGQLEQQDDNIQAFPSTSTAALSATDIEMQESAAMLEEDFQLAMDFIMQDLESSSSIAAVMSPDINIEEEYVDNIIPPLEQESSNILLDSDYYNAYEEGVQSGLTCSHASIYANIVVKRIANGVSEHSAKNFARSYIDGFSLSIENHQKGDCYAHSYAEAYADCISSGRHKNYAQNYAEIFAETVVSGKDVNYARNYAEANTDFIFVEEEDTTSEHIFEQMSANVDYTGGSIFNDNVEE
ncbi:hypothetical protein [Orientia tsutsugamushi]|uniref:hypothetical protein n=1 Tax=Orientia tsutsugamushi TaxID=784 RepID=UPI000D5A66A1|nr:Uncharacterised protein [Orientia tsutsugamushi]